MEGWAALAEMEELLQLVALAGVGGGGWEMEQTLKKKERWRERMIGETLTWKNNGLAMRDREKERDRLGIVVGLL